MSIQTFKDVPVGEMFSIENGASYVKQELDERTNSNAFEFNSLEEEFFEDGAVVSF